MDNMSGSNGKNRLLELFRTAEMKTASLREKEEKLLKHIDEINREREKLLRGSNRWKLLKALIMVAVVSTGIVIMFLPERTLIGKSIFSLEPPENLKIDIGKYTLVYVFTPNCPSCIEGLREMIVLQSKYQDKISVVGIALHESEHDIHQLSEEYAVNYQIILDREGKFLKKLGIDVVPVTIVVSDDSKIRKILYGPIPYERITEIVEKMDKSRKEEADR